MRRTVDDLLLSGNQGPRQTTSLSPHHNHAPFCHSRRVITPSPCVLTVRGTVASTEQSSAYLCLTFSEQQLHSDLDKLRLCNEFKLNSSSITSPQDPFRVVHRYDANSLADSLELMRTMVCIRKSYSLRNEAWPSIRILHQHGP